MPLPLIAEKLDAIPEAARGAYVEKNGKFVLDAEIEDTAGLKAKNAELIGANKKLAERAKVLGDRTAEEIQADLDLAAQARERKAKDEGNFEELKKLQALELKKRDDALATTEAEIYDLVARNAAIEAITAAGGKVKKLVGEVLKSVRVVKDGNVRVAQVVDAKGNPRIVDGQGTPMTIAQLVETFKADDDYAVDFAASGASGSGARNDGGGGGARGLVLIPKDATPQQYRAMKADAEKRGVPYQVAS
jgi:hypothetical protein